MIRTETLQPAFKAELYLVYIILVLLTTKLWQPPDVNMSSNSLSPKPIEAIEDLFLFQRESWSEVQACI